jgi:hypothetical protein
MRGIHRLFSAAAAVLLAATGLIVAGSGQAAHAYGHDGSMDVYQVGISFNCNNRTYCSADELGGFWGWAEFDHDPATGANTGDAEFAGCSHGTFKGAAHTSIEITDWYIAPGSAGPMTFFVTDESTTTFRGQRDVETETDADTGVPAVEGHYSSQDIFGITPPPGINAEITVAFKPAH